MEKIMVVSVSEMVMIFVGLGTLTNTVYLTVPVSSNLGVISRVSDKNGVFLLYIMLEMHHSGWEPSICNVARSTKL